MKTGTLEITLHYTCTEQQCNNALRELEPRKSAYGDYFVPVTRLQVSVEKFLQAYYKDTPTLWMSVETSKEGNYGVYASAHVCFQEEQMFGDLALQKLLKALKATWKLLTCVYIDTYPAQLPKDSEEADYNAYAINSIASWHRDTDRVRQSVMPEPFVDAIVAADADWDFHEDGSTSVVQDMCIHILDSLWKDQTLARFYTTVFQLGDDNGEDD
jgi:hypothetical protein